MKCALLALAPCLLLPSLVLAAEAAERTFPQLSYAPEELFHEISAINGPDAPDFHGTAFWYGGHLGIVFAKGEQVGGIALYDVSDPRAPQLVGRGTDSRQREGHTTAFIDTDFGQLAVTLASNGIHLWDLSDPYNPHVHTNINVPGIGPVDYDFGAWWIAAQAPYVYLAGGFNGLYILDLSDLDHPRVVDQLPVASGFRAGPVFAVGNFLVQAMSNGALVYLYDIGDPEKPVLLKEVTQLQRSYAAHFNGGYLYAAMKVGGLEIVDLSDPFSPDTLSTTSAEGAGAYTLRQDHYLHLGNSERYYLFDIEDPLAPVILGSAEIVSDHGVDNDFVSAMGNVLVLSDDHSDGTDNPGTRLIPVFAAPDETAPEVTFVSPADGATWMPDTSRVGVTLSDQLLVSSVGPETFIVRPVGGAPLSGTFSIQQQAINFSPDLPLSVNTTYELILPAGGVSDVSGNTLEEEFRSRFTVGPDPINPPVATCPAETVGYVGEGTTLSPSSVSGGMGALSYRWDPGDGSPSSAWSSSPTLLHVYDPAAHHTALLTVMDELGQLTRVACPVTIVHRPLSTPPTHSATIVLDEPGDRVWAVNPDADTVAAIDTSRLSLEAEIPVGDHPRTLARDGQGLVWVVNEESADLSLVDDLVLRELRRLALPPGSRPYGIVFDALGEVAYVSLSGLGEVWAIDALTFDVVWTRSVGPAPRGLALVEDRLFVTRFLSAADHGELTELDADTGAWVGTVELAEDPGPDSEIGSRGVPNYLSQVVPSPDGRSVFLPGFKQNTSRGLFRDGLPMTFETTNRALLMTVDLGASEELMGARIDLDNRDLASALALTPRGDYGFVALQGQQGVLVLDLLDGSEHASLPQVGLAPQGLVVTQGGLLFVQNLLGRNVTVYDVSDPSHAASLQRIAAIDTVGVEPLTSQQLLGKRIFYDASDDRMSRDDYLSCAGCHIEGGTDLRVWDFTDRGEGLRRTTTLRGRGDMLHGPVHWSANFDEIQDFENDIRNAFEGEGFLTDSDFSGHSATLGAAKRGLSPELDALAAYLGTLTRPDSSPWRESGGALSAAALRGRALFNDPAQGCATCHAGPHFTDSALLGTTPLLHDVGTLGAGSGKRMGAPLTGIDTPTLKGIWTGGPYLHDGSAATLREVLTTRNPQDRHGKTSHLSEAQLGDLEAWLRSIDGRSGAPVVVGTSPAVGQQLRGASQIVITFSSWVDPTTVAGIKVSLNGSAVVGVLTADEDRVIFTPSAAMGFGAVTVSVPTTLKSVDGDAAPAWSGSFTLADLPLVQNAVAYTPRAGAYALATNLQRGAKIWGDNGHTLLGLPRRYRGLTYLKTAAGDALETRPAMISFDLTAPARVYVAFDRTMDLLPGWAADLSPTGKLLATNEFEYSPLRVFVGEYPAGRVYLGAPRAAGGDHNKMNYFVFFEELAP